MKKSEKKSSEADGSRMPRVKCRQHQSRLKRIFQCLTCSGTTLELARFAAAMQELKDARQAFDAFMIEREAEVLVEGKIRDLYTAPRCVHVPSVAMHS